jgi:hypothetical protein
LDEHNGRFAITPDYPNGTYAYYVTIDEDANPIYPYSLGATYYGTLPSGNTGPQSGHNTVPANATHFTGNTPSTITTIFSEKIVVYPNPTNGQFEIKFDQPTQNTQLFIYNTSGTLIFQQADIANVQTIDLSTFANGLYLLRLVDENKQINSQKISKQTSN